MGVKLFIKVKGKCMIDYILMVGLWLCYCGYFDNIFNNMLIGVENYFNGKINEVVSQLIGQMGEVLVVQCVYKVVGIFIIVVGDYNYGEGFFCEYVVMELCYLGVCVVIVKLFVCIYEMNLKKQGMFGLMFVNEVDYDKIFEDDMFNFMDFEFFVLG